MEEELIEIVRNEPCLYDLKHPDYVKIPLKEAIWKRIGETLNLKDGHTAKRTWEKLRNSHRDALRRQHKIKSGSGTGYTKLWRFQEQMAFLIPHMANRSYANVHEETQNYESCHPHSDRDNEINIQEFIVDKEEPQTANEDTNQSSESSYTDRSVDQVHKRKRMKRNILNKSKEKHNLRIHDRHQQIETTNDFIVNNVKNDPLFHFFMSMYETTKRLPPISQHIIKNKVFALVSQEEAKNLIKG